MATKKDCFWRIMCAIMVVFFTMSSVVQHNDPDWFIWVPVYVLPAFISFAQVIRVQIRETPVFQVVVKFALLIYCILDIKLFAQLISKNSGEEDESSKSSPRSGEETHQRVNASLTRLNETSSSLTPSESILATEEGREFFGSLIITFWLILCCLQFTRVANLSLGCRFLIASFVLLPLVIWFVHFFYGIDLC